MFHKIHIHKQNKTFFMKINLVMSKNSYTFVKTFKTKQNETTNGEAKENSGSIC